MSHLITWAALSLAIVILILITLKHRHKHHGPNPAPPAPSQPLDPNNLTNPPPSYWFQRSDTGGIEAFNAGSLYLTQSVTSPATLGPCKQATASTDCPTSFCRITDQSAQTGVCVPYTNSEIYNSPCCTQSIKQDCQALWQEASKLDPDTASKLCGLLSNPSQQSACISKLQGGISAQPALAQQICDVVGDVCTGSGEVVPSELDIQGCHLQVNPAFVDIPWIELIQTIKDTFLNNPYLYADFSCTVQALGLDAGSRGWGFWNTKSVGGSMAWFMHQEGFNPDGTPYHVEGSPIEDGLYCMIVTPTSQGQVASSLFKLPDLDEQFHDYRIIWTPSAITFFVDGTQVFQETTTIVSEPMAIHIWVDNSVFGVDSKGIPQHWTHEFTGARVNNVKSLSVKALL